MKPSGDTFIDLLMARAHARAAQCNARCGYWDTAARHATKAGDYMKKVKWELDT